MATVLDKELRRQVTVGGAAYIVSLDPDGFRLTGKGKRKPEVHLQWRDLLSGDAALAVALHASLGTRAVAADTATVPTTPHASKTAKAKKAVKPPR